MRQFFLCLAFSQLLILAASAQVERVWLSYQHVDPSRITINWETSVPADSVVRYGVTEKLGQTELAEGKRTRHHVEIPVTGEDIVWYYSVGEEAHASAVASFKSMPSKTLRVAVVADWGFARDRKLDAVIKDDPHLLLTAGDNVASLYEQGLEGERAFSALIDLAPELFSRVPFMPILGNHDREITPRGPKPPEHAVYDVSASAYREFFALPGKEWYWSFDIPAFDIRFAALDLNHITDFGNTWQTCHAFDEGSEQFQWYRELIGKSQQKFFLTLMNERQLIVANETKGLWHEHFRKGSALISGFGYFAERAELDGLPYFNTCLKGNGHPFKDPKSAFFAQEDNYLLMTFERGAREMSVQIKSLSGEVLDTRLIEARK